MMCSYRLLIFSLGLNWVITGAAVGESPLHERIDAVLAQSQIGPPAPLAGDAEFFRRVHLDLTGRIPSSDEARKFLADPSPDKRQRLVEELFKSPATDRRLAKVFDIMLMQRRGDKHVKAPEWNAYLLASIQENKPYNQLAREILSADGADPKNRAAAKFYLDRDDLSINLVTRDIGRVFFGRDIECAQCHDHPLISDYEQSEYYGLLAFINRSSVFQPNPKKPAVIAETAEEGAAKFKSVFTGYEGETRPRLPGETEITEPVFKKGEEYLVKPAKNVRPVPKYSRRQKLAELAAAGTNQAFNKNIANRLWAVMMGRGLVDPVDLHHSENPPASPELLELLSKEFVAMNYDIKQFLKEIALSNTYQRSFRLPDSFEQNIILAEARLPKVDTQKTELQKQAETLLGSLNKLDAEQADRRAALASFSEKAKSVQTRLAAAEKAHNESKAAVEKLKSSLALKQDIAKLLAEASAKASLAAQKLPGDKSLAEASSQMSSQSKAWTEQSAVVQKQFDQKADAEKAAEAQLAAARKSAEAIQAEKAKIEALVQKAEAEIQTIRKRRTAALAAADAAGRDLHRMKLLVDYAEASRQLQAARESAKSLETELAAAQADSAIRADALAVSRERLAGIQSAQTEAAQSLQETKTLAANHSQAVRLVVEALAQLESARKQLPKDKQLAAVLEQLESARGNQKAQLTALDKAVARLEADAENSAEELSAMEKAITEAEAVFKKSQEAASAIEGKQKAAREESAKRDGALQEAEAALADCWTKHFRVASVEQLSPEQLGWSVLEAVGQVELQRTAALALWNKQHPDLAGKELTPEQQAEQAEFIEQTIRTKLAGQAAKFLPLFAANAGQPQHEFFATVEQALFFANGNDVLGWLRPGGGNLTDRLRKTEDPKALAEELYLSILTRRPRAEEIQDVTDYLTGRKAERDQAIQEMAWALLTSAEFRFQH